MEKYEAISSDNTGENIVPLVPDAVGVAILCIEAKAEKLIQSIRS